MILNLKKGVYKLYVSVTCDKKGGEVGGSARKDVERKSGNKIVSKGNFLGLEGGERGRIAGGAG